MRWGGRIFLTGLRRVSYKISRIVENILIKKLDFNLKEEKNILYKVTVLLHFCSDF